MKRKWLSYGVGMVTAAVLTGVLLYSGNHAKVQAQQNEMRMVPSSCDGITTYTFEQGYGRFLSIYDTPQHEGGERHDNGKQVIYLSVRVGTHKYRAAFILDENSDADVALAEYKEAFASGRFTEDAQVEAYLNTLLKQDVITFYCCIDLTKVVADSLENKKPKGLYAESFLEE